MGGHARDYKRGGGAEVRPHVLRPISGPMLLDLLFLTGYRVSAVVGACVGYLETDGVE